MSHRTNVRIEMDFTDEQKLIITMLAEIHDQLKITDGVNPQFVQEMITGGNSWALRWQYPGIFQGPSETPRQVKRVRDVLDMWEVLERTVAALSPEEQARLDELCRPITVSSARFTGYSGNGEEEFSIVHILVEDLQRWSTFRGWGLQCSCADG